MVAGKLATLDCDVCFTVEGRADDELPLDPVVWSEKIREFLEIYEALFGSRGRLQLQGTHGGRFELPDSCSLLGSLTGALETCMEDPDRSPVQKNVYDW